MSLTNFQKDLGTVSAEIETLQSRSTTLNTRLENRRVVEKLLGPAVEEISIAPAIVRTISEGSIDQDWVKALAELEKRSKAIDGKMKGPDKILAITDIKPLLDDLTNKVNAIVFVVRLFVEIKVGYRKNTRLSCVSNQSFAGTKYECPSYPTTTISQIQGSLCLLSSTSFTACG